MKYSQRKFVMLTNEGKVVCYTLTLQPPMGIDKRRSELNDTYYVVTTSQLGIKRVLKNFNVEYTPNRGISYRVIGVILSVFLRRPTKTG